MKEYSKNISTLYGLDLNVSSKTGKIVISIGSGLYAEETKVTPDKIDEIISALREAKKSCDKFNNKMKSTDDIKKLCKDNKPTMLKNLEPWEGFISLDGKVYMRVGTVYTAGGYGPREHECMEVKTRKTKIFYDYQNVIPFDVFSR